jgi:hypothetical protein
VWEAYMDEHLADIEAEAFCEDLKIDPLPYNAALYKYGDWLSSSYPELQPLSGDSAMKLIHKYCKGERWK